MVEYIGNVLYAVFVRRLSKVGLCVLVALSAYFTIDICFNLDTFGLFDGREACAYTVIGGFGLTGQQIYIGMARLLFPFFGGLLLYRLGLRIKLPRYGFIWCSLAIAAILAWPHAGGSLPNPINGTYCAMAIIVLFPMIYVQMKWAADHADTPLGTHIWVAVWIFIAAIAVAYACLKLYDEPTREWLKKRWLTKREKA